METLATERLNFWNKRAKLGFAAGSNDVNIKALEINALESQIPQEGKILDAGCGNGHTIRSIAVKRKNLEMVGFDYSPKMVEESRNLIKKEGIESRVSIIEANLMEINTGKIEQNQFDCVYTQRSLINLDSFDDQIKAIQHLWDLVKIGGKLVLCEAFQDGLDEINKHRAIAGLETISKPWHNTYLRCNDLDLISRTLGSDHRIIEFSGTYYFVSRVIHAWQAKQRSSEPSYIDPINLMSLELPAIDTCGQSKIVVFTKKTPI